MSFYLSFYLIFLIVKVCFRIRPDLFCQCQTTNIITNKSLSMIKTKCKYEKRIYKQDDTTGLFIHIIVWIDMCYHTAEIFQETSTPYLLQMLVSLPVDGITWLHAHSVQKFFS
jgi:hypothetical protein